MALPFRKHAPIVTAVLLVVIGVFAVVRRPETVLSILPKLQAKDMSAIERVENLESESMPCCDDDRSDAPPTDE